MGGSINMHNPRINVSPQQLTLKDAQLLALRVLKQVMEEKLDHHNVQVAQVCCYLALFHASGAEIEFSRSRQQMDSRF